MAKTCPNCSATNLQSASTCTHCGSNLEVINKPTEELNDIVRDEVLSEPNVDKNSKKEEKPRMFRNPFSFNGRIRRTEYGISFIIYAIVAFFGGLVQGIAEETGAFDGSGFMILGIVYILGAWFSLAQGAKRCHDMGISGWYQIIPFFPIWMIFAKGDAEANEYGNSPK